MTNPTDKCAANLAALIAASKAPHPSILCDGWNDLRWPLACKRKRGEANHDSVWFTANSASKGQTPIPFSEPFASFARAMMWRTVKSEYQLGTITPYYSLQVALRFLHEQVEAGRPISDLTGLHFANADHANRTAHTVRSAQNFSYALKKIVKAVNDLQLTPGRIDWQPEKVSKADLAASREESAARRAELLLTKEEMWAWAKLSLDPGPNPRDRIIQRVIDLMLCGGLRVGEAVTLPYDTLVEQARMDENGEPILDAEGQPAIQFGLRYWPEKGGCDQTLVRPIPTVMAPIAVRAVEELKELTRRTRAVALAHFEDRSPFEDPQWRDLDGNYMLRTDEVADILELSQINRFDRGRHFVESRGFRSFMVDYVTAMNTTFEVPCVMKSDIEKYARMRSFTQTCIDAEDKFIPLHESLAILPYLAKGGRSGLGGTAVPVTRLMVGTYLASMQDVRSAFEKRGLAYARSGEPIAITPNMFRHWVDTMALLGGLGHMDIARWMGRTKIDVNRAYDHRTDDEKGDHLHEIAAATVNTEIDFPAARSLDADAAEDGAGHVTAAGICGHSFASPPCPSFLQSVEDGTFERSLAELSHPALAALSRGLSRTIKASERAFEDGVYGAGQWVALNRRLASIVAAFRPDRGASAPPRIEDAA